MEISIGNKLPIDEGFLSLTGIGSYLQVMLQSTVAGRIGLFRLNGVSHDLEDPFVKIMVD